jgi:hypothetical protein
MEMEKSHYLVTRKASYLDLVRDQSPAGHPDSTLGEISDSTFSRLVVSITQGGFGQDVVDFERQTKERFLEYLFETTGVDLPRSAESFDQYFELEEIDEVIDLDEDA